MVQSDRSNLIWPNDIIITWHSWLALSCISSQWACCSTFKYSTSACSSSSQRALETLLLPQLHLYRSATRWFMYVIWGLFHVCYICSSSISYMLTAACCGCIGSSKSRSLLCRSSRSIPARPNTLTLPCTLPCQSLRELSWQYFLQGGKGGSVSSKYWVRKKIVVQE